MRCIRRIVCLNEKIINRFLNHKVKLVKENYALYGKILEIEGDSIVFETNDRISVIRIDVIQEITLLNK